MQINFKIAGANFEATSDAGKLYLAEKLSEGDKVKLKREYCNPHDKNALVIKKGRSRLGYVPKTILSQFSNVDFLDDVVGTITKVNGRVVNEGRVCYGRYGIYFKGGKARVRIEVKIDFIDPRPAFNFNKISSFSGISGIYMITNISNQQSYIGSSSDVGMRLISHIQDLMRGVHHNKKLQSDWSYITYEQFSFKLLKKVKKEKLLEEEKNFIKKYKTYNQYNLTIDGDSLNLKNKITPLAIAKLEYVEGDDNSMYKYGIVLPSNQAKQKSDIIKKLALKGHIESINYAFNNILLFREDINFLLEILPKYEGNKNNYRLATCLEENNNVKCISIYKELVKQDNAYAYWRLGMLYKKGKMIERNANKGNEMLAYAERKGLSFACSEMSFFEKIYYRGLIYTLSNDTSFFDIISSISKKFIEVISCFIILYVLSRCGK